MSAVDISKLKEQCRLAAEQYGSPRQLVNTLRILFESYADRTYQLAGTKRPSLKIPEYHLPPLVLREIELTLAKYCDANPLTTLEIIDILWQEPMMEPRQVAATLLGKLNSQYFSEVTDHLVRWISSIEESRLIEYIVLKGSTRIRQESPEQWIQILEDWLNSRDLDKQNLAFQSFIPLINDRQFENLPEMYNLLTPQLRNIDPRGMASMQSVIEALIKRSPKETAYFLKQVSASSTDANFYRLMRRCLSSFPVELRSSLREVIVANQPE